MCMQAMPGTAPVSTYDTYSAAALDLLDLLERWDILQVSDVITTDTAANVKAMMKYIHKNGCSETVTDSCACFSWDACVCHVLNLVVKSDLFSGVLINVVIEQGKDIATYYNHLLLARMLEPKEPLEHLMAMEQWDDKVPFVTPDSWTLIKKLCTVTEAMEALSSRSASIAEVRFTSRRDYISCGMVLTLFCQVIPIVSTIMADLAVGGDDHGVRGLKRDLLGFMDRRLGDWGWAGGWGTLNKCLT